MLIKRAWSLGKDFFIEKEQRSKAYVLLIASIILQLALVYGSVLMNQWSSDFYNALQNLDKPALYKALKTFCIVVAFLIFTFVAKYVCQARLALSWRQFMTEKYCARWVKNNAYFGFNLLDNKNDNPDQRISEDLNTFVNLTIELSFGILEAVVTLLSFITILWTLSGILEFTAFNIDFVISGYLVWAALLYSVMGTIVTYIIGRRLSEVDYLQEQKEANFRFSMMRVRENSESISLYKGEEYERNIFRAAFDEVVKNTLSIISITKNIGIWSNLFNNFSNVMPILIACPMYFAKKIMLGGLMQIASAFGQVQDSLSFLASSFKTIASYKAVIDRLNGFNAHIDQWNQVALNNKIKLTKHNSVDLILKNLTICTPNNQILLNKLNLSFAPSNSYLITGNNGSGKSTLVKAMAGIWIFGEGEIIFPENKSIFFIPQKIYMNSGTLLQVITYPDNKKMDVKYIIELMKQVNLTHLIGRLSLQENWSISLSLGQQQEIAILRTIIHNPDILIMDESSSSMTEEDEELVYKLLKNKLPNAIIISVGHRYSLRKLHDHEINISA